MSLRSHAGVFWTLAAFGAAIDLASKWLAFSMVGAPGPTSSVEVMAGVFSFTTSHNQGALFGFGGQTQVANYIFATLSVVAASLIVYWVHVRNANRDQLLSVALGLIMGGTIGNCYDRLVHGMVRDFLYFELIDWPIFNIADSCLVSGASLLMFQALFADVQAKGRQSAADPNSVEAQS